MTLSQEIERAIGLCNDAVVAPEHWTEALDRMAWALGAEASRLLPHDPAERPPALPQINPDAGVSLEAMQGEPIFIRIDRNGANAKFSCRAEYTNCNFAAVGNQQSLNF